MSTETADAFDRTPSLPVSFRYTLHYPRELNEIIWFSVKGETPVPSIARLPAFELMTAGVKPEDEEEAEEDD